MIRELIDPKTKEYKDVFTDPIIYHKLNNLLINSYEANGLRKESYFSNEVFIQKNIVEKIGSTYNLEKVFNLISQDIDQNGKVFKIDILNNSDKVSLFIKPHPPLYLPIDKVIYKTNDIKLFNPESYYIKSNLIKGYWTYYNENMKVFIYTNDIKNSNQDVKLTTKIPIIDKKESELKKYEHMKKIALILKQMVVILFLFHIKQNNSINVKSFLDKYILVDNTKKQYVINNITDKFYDMKSSLNVFSKIIPNLFNNGKLSLSNDMYYRIEYIILLLERDINNNMFKVNTIPDNLDYILSKFESKDDSNVRSFDSEFDLYDFLNTTKYKTDKIIHKLDKIRFTLSKEPLFYKTNTNVYLIQFVYGNSIERASNLVKIWNETNVNVGFYTKKINQSNIRITSKIDDVIPYNNHVLKIDNNNAAILYLNNVIKKEL